MSARYDDIWTLGEDWGFSLSCRDADGQPFTPSVAHWELRFMDGTLAIAKNSPVIAINADVCTVSVPVSEQTAFTAGQILAHRFLATTTAGGKSYQLSGMIEIRA